MRVFTILQKCSPLLTIKVIRSKLDDNENAIIIFEGSADNIITNEVLKQKVRKISCQENILKLYV